MSEWLKLGASQGDANCQFALGVMAMNRGQKEPRFYAEAMKWFLRAADQGNAPAQDKIGLMYRDGLGVEKDYVQAFMWFSIAAEISKQYFTPLRDALALKMTPEEVAEGKRRAAAWKPGKKKSQPQTGPDGLLV